MTIFLPFLFAGQDMRFDGFCQDAISWGLNV